MDENKTLIQELTSFLPPERILGRAIDRIAYACDASFYRLIPKAVVRPSSFDEIRDLFAFSHQSQIPLTFRAAGTSLSGQAVTDGILVDVSRFWRKIQIDPNGDVITLGTGVVGVDANLALKPYHRRIGPDPASIDAAMLGGMIANNSSGMCCGVVENSYHTLESLVMMLPDGLVLDTAEPTCGETFRQQAPETTAGLLALRDEILANPGLCERIRAKYRSKNTTGYSLNAFLDYDTPEQILAHLMVGSEGTLGFIGEVRLRTLPDYPLKLTALLLFETVQDAASAVFPIRDSGARAIEFMDRASLRSVEKEEGIREMLGDLPDSAAALLVEYQVNTAEELEAARQAAQVVTGSLALLRPVEFTEQADQQALLWKIRKGLYPSIGGMRTSGSSLLIEDVTFPVEKLADAVNDLQSLFIINGYYEAIIFGHAKDGNLHFVLTPSFDTKESITKYARFIEDVVSLVVEKYDGALKGEHGTGRNMAPFVEREWGQEAFNIMLRLKKLVDPDNLLNPGVILNDDPKAHLRHLKTWSIVEKEVDLCVECGFCEPKCPSRDLTLTPRRRIVVRREIARMEFTGEDPRLLDQMVRDYQYDGLDTCATDGYCALACPLHLDTGMLVKHLRAEAIPSKEQDRAVIAARYFGVLETGLRSGIVMGHAAEKLIGTDKINQILAFGEKRLHTTLPKWSEVIPAARLKRITASSPTDAEVVYFPSCITRAMGTSLEKGEAAIIELFAEVSARAGVKLYIPADSAGNCCGMPFSSKGYRQAFIERLHRTVTHFWNWSEQGKLPVVIDSSSCAYTLLTAAEKAIPEDRDKLAQMTILDPVDYAYQFLLPKLNLHPLPDAVVLHPNCSAVKLGLAGKMVSVARACAQSVTVPTHLGCCGYAGDRGLLFPELTQSASQIEASEVNQMLYDGYYSSNLTCEMGMRQATGKPYRSIFYLLEKASR